MGIKQHSVEKCKDSKREDKNVVKRSRKKSKADRELFANETQKDVGVETIKERAGLEILETWR